MKIIYPGADGSTSAGADIPLSAAGTGVTAYADNTAAIDLETSETYSDSAAVDQNHSLTVTEGARTNVTKVTPEWTTTDIGVTRADGGETWNTDTLTWDSGTKGDPSVTANGSSALSCSGGTAYNGYISATGGAQWSDAAGFVEAMNNAMIAPEGKTRGGSSGNSGTGYWRLLSSEDDAQKRAYAASGEESGFGAVSGLWSSEEEGSGDADNRLCSSGRRRTASKVGGGCPSAARRRCPYCDYKASCCDNYPNGFYYKATHGDCGSTKITYKCPGCKREWGSGDRK